MFSSSHSLMFSASPLAGQPNLSSLYFLPCHDNPQVASNQSDELQRRTTGGRVLHFELSEPGPLGLHLDINTKRGIVRFSAPVEGGQAATRVAEVEAQLALSGRKLKGAYLTKVLTACSLKHSFDHRLLGFHPRMSCRFYSLRLVLSNLIRFFLSRCFIRLLPRLFILSGQFNFSRCAFYLRSVSASQKARKANHPVLCAACHETETWRSQSKQLKCINKAQQQHHQQQDEQKQQ